jgi:hypothetical protein
MRARAKNIPFDDRIYRLKESPLLDCACCHRPLVYTTRRGIEGRRSSPSLDRLENTEGYTLENTRVICYRCNEVKGDATLAELKIVIDYIERENATRILALAGRR